MSWNEVLIKFGLWNNLQKWKKVDIYSRKVIDENKSSNNFLKNPDLYQWNYQVIVRFIYEYLFIDLFISWRLYALFWFHCIFIFRIVRIDWCAWNTWSGVKYLFEEKKLWMRITLCVLKLENQNLFKNL